MCSLIVPEPRNPKSRASRAVLPLGGSRGGSLLPLPAPGDSRLPAPLISSSGAMWLCSLFLRPSLSLKRRQSSGFGLNPVQGASEAGFFLQDATKNGSYFQVVTN